LADSPSLEEAAATLGIDPSTLYRKRKRYGL
jgi:transcriptional regulator of acetoin/glycerol metabolism